jgi:serine/threonine-protein kinase
LPGTSIANSIVMIEVGHTVGNYKVTAKLGEGGMGIVFLAEHPVIGRKAALKAIHPEHLRNAEVVARFVNEAKSINQIGHDHIVEVTDFGRTPAGDFYFIMEYLQGESLSERLHRDAPLEVPRAVAIAVQIADALEASHTHGVIHRDLKPENIFLVERSGVPDFVKVLDFGLAKLLHDENGRHDTRAGVVMGTPYYMPPEQCQGREIDRRADIYALGVILFEMLTGKLPFGGDGYTDVLVKQMTMRPPPARSLAPQVPEALDAVLLRALAKTPAERFPTMAAFRKALLHPASMSGVVPQASIHDDPSGRVRAARPMTRAEIASRRTLALVPVPHLATNTFDEGTGAFQTEEDDDLVPARNRSRGVALVSAATLAGVALAAVLTYGDTSRDPAAALALAPQGPPQRMVPVSFSSDPDGAVITSSNGVKLGTTPLSIEIPASDAPVVYVFRKEGFLAKAISFIPNIPSPVFAFMQPELVASVRDAGPGPEPDDERSVPRAPRPRPAHRRVSAAVEPPPQQPGPSVGSNVGTAVAPAVDPNVDGLMPPTFAPLQP